MKQDVIVVARHAFGQLLEDGVEHVDDSLRFTINGNSRVGGRGTSIAPKPPRTLNADVAKWRLDSMTPATFDGRPCPTPKVVPPQMTDQEIEYWNGSGNPLYPGASVPVSPFIFPPRGIDPTRFSVRRNENGEEIFEERTRDGTSRRINPAYLTNREMNFIRANHQALENSRRRGYAILHRFTGLRPYDPAELERDGLVREHFQRLSQCSTIEERQAESSRFARARTEHQRATDEMRDRRDSEEAARFALMAMGNTREINPAWRSAAYPPESAAFISERDRICEASQIPVYRRENFMGPLISHDQAFAMVGGWLFCPGRFSRDASSFYEDSLSSNP